MAEKNEPRRLQRGESQRTATIAAAKSHVEGIWKNPSLAADEMNAVLGQVSAGTAAIQAGAQDARKQNLEATLKSAVAGTKLTSPSKSERERAALEAELSAPDTDDDEELSWEDINPEFATGLEVEAPFDPYHLDELDEVEEEDGDEW